MAKPLEKLIVTQPFGARPEYYRRLGLKAHEGVDFKTTNLGTSQGWYANLMGWQKLFAPVSGTVTVDYSGPYGTHIYLQDDAGNRWLFAHLKNARCSSGDRVAEGQLIGVTGKTGSTQGAHLHISLRPKNYDVNNGFFGNVDPMPYLNKFVMEYTCINADQNVLEEARQLLMKLSEGKVDASFRYIYMPEVKVNGLFDTEAQIQFLKVYPIQTPFGYIHYTSLTDQSGYDFARTNSVPGINLVLTMSENITPISMCYEMANALTDYFLDLGFPIVEPYIDQNIATEEYIKHKLNKILPYIGTGI